MLAPIVLFAYLRIDTLQAVINSLQKNELVSETDLYIFCDGVKTDEQRKKQQPLIDLIYDVKGFKSVTVNVSTINRGLDPSIIMGVSEIVNKYGKVIVLEDDVIVAPNFLLYMNQCLEAVLISFDKFVKHDLDECNLYHSFCGFSKEFIIDGQPSEVFQP